MWYSTDLLLLRTGIPGQVNESSEDFAKIMSELDSDDDSVESFGSSRDSVHKMSHSRAVRSKKFAFHWEIKNFKDLCKRNQRTLPCNELESRRFKVPGDFYDNDGRRHSGLKLRLRLRMDTELHGEKWEEWEFFADIIGSPSCNCKIAFRMTDDKGTEVDGMKNSREFSTYKGLYDVHHKFRDTFGRKTRRWKGNSFLKVDRRSVRSWLRRKCDKMTVVAEIEFADYMAGGPTLPDELRNFDPSETQADVEIVCPDRSFRTYKSLLMARSDVFRTMLEQANFVENASNQVRINDVTSEVMGAFLDFVQSDKAEIDNLWQFASELYAVAHKYNVDGLRGICRRFIVTNMSVEDCANNILLGELYDDKAILKEALVILREDAPAVVRTDGWKRLLGKDPQRAVEILAEIISTS